MRRTTICLALCTLAACGTIAMQDTLARGPLDAALAELDTTPEGDRAELVRAIARSRLALSASDEATRARTFARLAWGGQGTRALLEALADDGSPDVATRALLALTLRGERGAARRLSRYAEDADDTLRSRGRVAETLSLSPREALERLTSTTADERRAALRALGGGGSPDVIEALVAVARRDPDVGVRAAACRAMPRLSDADRALVRTIVDEARAHAVVSACAKRALDDAPAEEQSAFVQALVDPADDLAIARAQAALAALGRGDALDALDAYLLRALASSRPSIRAATASLLGARREKAEVRAALVALLTGDAEPGPRLAAAAALRADVEARDAVLATLRALIALEAHVALEAAELAVGIEDFTPETQARVERALSSSVVADRTSAYRIFVAMGDVRRALEGLFDPDLGVRIGTAVALLDR